MFLAENAATIRPAPCAHGSRSLRLMHMGPVFCVRSLVGSPVAPVSVDSSDRDIAPFAHPFVEGAGSGRLQRSCIDDSDRLLCHKLSFNTFRYQPRFRRLLRRASNDSPPFTPLQPAIPSAREEYPRERIELADPGRTVESPSWCEHIRRPSAS